MPTSDLGHARWAAARAVLCVLRVAKGVTEGDFEYAKDCEEAVDCYVRIAEQEIRREVEL